MRTHRITLMVTAAEKERIGREAAILGVSADEYVRKAAALLDAEDVIALREIPSLLPEFNAALDRIHANLVAAAERSERTHQEIERMRTPEYRDEVRRSVMKDEVGLDAVARLFGFTRPEETPSKGRARVNEPREPWVHPEPQGKKPKRRK